jgi:hypothetical protein
MTAVEFWHYMMLNYVLRGNAYARIERNNGEVTGLMPLSADQVEVDVLSDGSLAYSYLIGSNKLIYPESDILHIRGMGTGVVGMSPLAFGFGEGSEMLRPLAELLAVLGPALKVLAFVGLAPLIAALGPLILLLKVFPEIFTGLRMVMAAVAVFSLLLGKLLHRSLKPPKTGTVNGYFNGSTSHLALVRLALDAHP